MLKMQHENVTYFLTSILELSLFTQVVCQFFLHICTSALRFTIYLHTWLTSVERGRGLEAYIKLERPAYYQEDFMIVEHTGVVL